MPWLDWFTGQDKAAQARQAASLQRRAEIENSLQSGLVPPAIRARLEATRQGRLPWIATLTPAELQIARTHGLRPIASVSATCWLHHGWSWTEGHTQGWHTALTRLQAEANAAGANAVLDVKMRTLPLGIENSTDFTLVGTAVYVEGLTPSLEPVVATVPALEFVRLLDADILPTGIAVGAKYGWLDDWFGETNLSWQGNIESQALSTFWEGIRRQAHAELRRNAHDQGNGVLADLHFSQLLKIERDKQPKRFLGRHIVIATIVDVPRGTGLPYPITPVVDMHAGSSPLNGRRPHHQAYGMNDQEGGI